MTADLRLDGKVAVVTGAARGIGRAVANRLAEAGATVLGLDRAPAGDLSAAGGSTTDLVCDVASAEQVAAAFDQVERAHGGVDVLVNNAAVGSHTAPDRLGVEELTEVLRIDVVGYFLAAQAAHRSMRARGGGVVVNLSSIAGSSALGRGNLAYSVAKAAVDQLTRELAVEWAADGVRVCGVAPSQVRTEGFLPLLSDPGLDGGRAGERMLRGIPLGRLAEPDEVAAVVHFLASPAAGFVTGVTVPVDGGNLALNAGGTPGVRTSATPAGTIPARSPSARGAPA